MTDDDLTALEEKARAATSGPWALAGERVEQHHEQCPWNAADVERRRSVCGGNNILDAQAPRVQS